jgi:hypothetical protein
VVNTRSVRLTKLLECKLQHLEMVIGHDAHESGRRGRLREVQQERERTARPAVLDLPGADVTTDVAREAQVALAAAGGVRDAPIGRVPGMRRARQRPRA